MISSKNAEEMVLMMSVFKDRFLFKLNFTENAISRGSVQRKASPKPFVKPPDNPIASSTLTSFFFKKNIVINRGIKVMRYARICPVAFEFVIEAASLWKKEKQL